MWSVFLSDGSVSARKAAAPTSSVDIHLARPSSEAEAMVPLALMVWTWDREKFPDGADVNTSYNQTVSSSCADLPMNHVGRMIA